MSEMSLPGGWSTPSATRPAVLVVGAACAVLAVVLAAACGPARVDRQAAAEGATPDVPVMTAPATDEDVVSTFEAGGVVRARTTAAIASRVMAPITGIQVRTGDRVRRGATLVTLDARELTAQVARSRASRVAADEGARAAASHREVAEAELTLARATSARISGLFEKQSATAHERDQSDAALRAAEAAVAAAHAQALAAAAARDAAHAGFDAADIGLSYTVLTAPFDGVVAARSADPGALAMPGVPLLTLEEAGALRLEVTVDETRAAGLSAGQPVDVRLDGSNAEWMTATTAEIGRIDPATHSFLVKIDLPPGTTARTGGFGRARFAGASRRALTVATTSLVRRGQLAFVYLVEAGARVRLRPVTPGPAVGDRTEILAGLLAGDVVVVAPSPDLRDGAAVAGSGASRAVSAGGR